MIVKNCIIITDKNSVLESTGNDTISGTAIYGYESISWKQWNRGENVHNRLAHFLVKLFYSIGDLIHGVESCIKRCCIIAYIRGKALYINGIDRSLCYKCYKKLLNRRK